jgi:hypothetical protein
MNVTVFHTRRLAEANRAADLLRDAGIAHTRGRLVGGIAAEMPHDPADMPAVFWFVQVPKESADEAARVLAPLVEETGARPPRTWLGPLYLIALFALVAAMAIQTCGSR